MVALLNAGADTINSVKQANEFGITQGQRLATGLFYLNDAYALGLRMAQTHRRRRLLLGSHGRDSRVGGAFPTAPSGQDAEFDPDASIRRSSNI